MKNGIREDRAGFLDTFLNGFFSAGDDLLVSEEQRREALALSEPARDEAVVACIDAFGRTDLRADLDRIDVPVLVAHGDADAIVPLEVSDVRSAERLEDARLHVAKNGPHGFNVSHADELNRVLLEFLAD